jgi:hypothetical protein
MSLAVWNNNKRASKQLVCLSDKRAQESLVMSLYGKPEIWTAICRPMEEVHFMLEKKYQVKISNWDPDIWSHISFSS